MSAGVPVHPKDFDVSRSFHEALGWTTDYLDDQLALMTRCPRGAAEAGGQRCAGDLRLGSGWRAAASGGVGAMT